jgi:hypothetical protein
MSRVQYQGSGTWLYCLCRALGSSGVFNLACRMSHPYHVLINTCGYVSIRAGAPQHPILPRYVRRGVVKDLDRNN